ncbi:hypothetical protein [Devosia sp. UYZn731]|uniref:hypothetical protein n=1 Tax=Devosia sp. UYZn731 TaxID=3156345 RepID=UPI00339443BE
MDLGDYSIWEVGEQLIDCYQAAVFPLMEGPSWPAAAVYVNFGGDDGAKTTIWLYPRQSNS